MFATTTPWPVSLKCDVFCKRCGAPAPRREGPYISVYLLRVRYRIHAEMKNDQKPGGRSFREGRMKSSGVLLHLSLGRCCSGMPFFQ